MNRLVSARSVLAMTLVCGLFAGAAGAQQQEKPAKEKPAAKQPEKDAKASKMAKQEDLVGKPAPDFKLVDTDGVEHVLADYTKQGKVVVLEWFNPGCPYVKLHYETHTTMKDTAKKYEGKEVVWLAVATGATADRDSLAQARTDWEIAYPVLLDAEGEAGRAYGSKNTPTMYVIDKEGNVAYAGAIDNDPQDSKTDDVNYVEKAVDALLAGSLVETGYAKAYGCSVKYKG